MGQVTPVQTVQEELARRQQQDIADALRDPRHTPTVELQKVLDAAGPPPNPLAIPPLLDPVGHARDLALAAAEICRAKQLLPQSRVQAIRLLNMAIAVLGT